MKKDTLTALDIALAAAPDNGPPREGEFTVYDYMEAINNRGGNLTRFRANQILTNEVNQGKLTVRKGLYNGTAAKIYGKPSNAKQ